MGAELGEARTAHVQCMKLKVGVSHFILSLGSGYPRWQDKL